MRSTCKPQPSSASAPRSRAATIHALVFTGGVAALSWEVIWQLQASLAFGVSAAGTALTLAATMGGLTAGSLAMGARLRGGNVARPLRLYGSLEAVIGISGLIMLPGFRALEALDAVVFSHAPTVAPALHALGIALLLCPATLAMGASVPVFQLVARRHRTSVASLYGINTAGAAAGVLLLSFWILPALGVWKSCALASTLNGVVFAATRGRGRLGSHRDDGPSPTATGGGAVGAVPLLVVFCTGFATFGLEVAWFRALRAAFWSTSSTFAIMLAAVLIPLALGARTVPLLRRRGIAPGTMLMCAGVAILLATPAVERMDLVATIELPHSIALASWFLLTLAAIGPAVFCLATALPWFLEEAGEPGAIGRLYGFNTLGSVAGSVVAAWALLPMLGFARSSWVLGLVVLGAAVFMLQPRRRWAALAAGAVAVAIAAVFSSSAGRDRMLGHSDLAGNEILAFDEGPDFTTAVIESANGTRSLYVDGFSATNDDAVSSHYMRWMGSLPALLHPDPQRGLVICFGTGQTANALRRDMPGRIDVVDISRAVFDLAGHFDANEAVLEEARVEAITMDGRAWLRRSDRRYDVITLEPMPPNFSGVNSLYSREFYEIMASRLEPGGIAAQWLPIHLLTPDHAASVSATFAAVFPDAILWMDPLGATGILLGRRSGASAPLGATWPGLARSERVRSLTDGQVRRSVLLDPTGLARYAKNAELVTDDNQLLQFSQLRAGLRGERSRRLNRQNQVILSEVAGRAPYWAERPSQR